jgi:adenylate cyclase
MAAFDGEVLRSEVLRASILAAVFGTSCVIATLAPLLFHDYLLDFFRSEQALATVRLALYPVFAYTLVLRLAIGRLITRRQSVPRWLAALSTIVESAIPTLILWLAGTVLDPALVLFTPPALIYFLFIIVAALRLDARLCVLAGVTSAVGYVAVALWALQQPGAAVLDGLLRSPLHHVGKGIIIAFGGVAAGIVSQQIRRQIAAGFRHIEERNRVAGVFGQHVSPAVVERLLADGAAPISELRRICVMFLDIRDFTSFAEHRSPAEVVDYLNRLFGFMVELVSQHDGIVNKFLGDGFMAVFGAPLATDDDAGHAVAAALAIEARVAAEVLAGTIPPTRIGIGLHLGEALTGTIGSQQRREYTVIGDAVNLAARIEALNKQFSTTVLASGDVVRALAGRHHARSLGPVAVKGRAAPIEVFALSSAPP